MADTTTDNMRNVDPFVGLLLSVYDQVLREYHAAQMSGMADPIVVIFDLHDSYANAVARLFLGDDAVDSRLADIAGNELASLVIAVEHDSVGRLPAINVDFIARRRYLDVGFLVDVIAGGISVLVALDAPMTAPPDAGAKNQNPLLN